MKWVFSSSVKGSEQRMKILRERSILGTLSMPQARKMAIYDSRRNGRTYGVGRPSGREVETRSNFNQEFELTLALQEGVGGEASTVEAVGEKPSDNLRLEWAKSKVLSFAPQ